MKVPSSSSSRCSRRLFLRKIALATCAAALVRLPPSEARAEDREFKKSQSEFESRGLLPVGDEGLMVEEVYPGDGTLSAEKGSIVTVRWVLRRANGYFVAANYGYGGSFDEYTYTAGSDAVIPGFDAGLIGIRKGGRRKLIVPPALGYTGKQLVKGPLPAENSARRNIKAHMKENLFFEVLCTKVKPPIDATILPSQ